MTVSELIAKLDGVIINDSNLLIIFITSLVTVIFLSVFLIYFFNKKEKLAKYRQLALTRLNNLDSCSDKEFLKQVNIILKDVARTTFGVKVVLLEDKKWLKFLNKTGGEYLFGEEERLIFQEVYSSTEIKINRKKILHGVCLWVKNHKKISKRGLNEFFK